MLKKNLENIFSKLNNGNNLGETITLVGATKTVSCEIINNAISLGLQVVAENRVQEFREKEPFVKGAIWHFIGHLQTNKVKYLIGKVHLIHSVDSYRLANEISLQAQKKQITQKVLCEINVGGELSKSGFNFENAIDSVKQVCSLKNLTVCGLMAMLPHSDDKEYLKNLCLKMREIYDKLNSEGYNFKYLSIGMSNDYEIAINNGSNMVRIGSGIFGKRNYN